MGNHKELLQFLRPHPAVAAGPATKSSSTTSDDEDDDDYSYYGGDTSCSTAPATPATSASASTAASPYAASPWTQLPGLGASPHDATTNKKRTGLLGSLVKEGGGHVYSLAAAGDLLYTGTDSRNVRVWRD